jgi:hypothetical protein
MQGALFRDAKNFGCGLGRTMENDELADLARRYLDLWVEYWGASLTAPETSALIARFMGEAADQGRASNAKAFDDAFGVFGAWAKPAPVPAAPDPGDERARELEDRVAALERRLAEFERAAAGASRRPRAGNRKS